MKQRDMGTDWMMLQRLLGPKHVKELTAQAYLDAALMKKENIQNAAGEDCANLGQSRNRRPV